MLRDEETLQKAVECACRSLADDTSRHALLERLIADVMRERPDLMHDTEALAEEALARLPEFLKHIEEQ